MSKLKFLKTLQEIIADRVGESPDNSYTARLATKGTLKVAQKLGEEAVELALAAVAEDDARVTEEAADLIYHLLLLLTLRDVRLSQVVQVLERRHADALARV